MYNFLQGYIQGYHSYEAKRSDNTATGSEHDKSAKEAPNDDRSNIEPFVLFFQSQNKRYTFTSIDKQKNA